MNAAVEQNIQSEVLGDPNDIHAEIKPLKTFSRIINVVIVKNFDRNRLAEEVSNTGLEFCNIYI